MKKLKYILITLCTFLILASCGNESKKIKAELENAAQTVKNANKVADEAPAMQKNMQELRTKTPLTKEQWESWLPEKLIDLPHTSSFINSTSGLGSCGITYHILNKRVEVMVFDGAGDIGASSVGVYIMSSIKEYNQVADWGYEKSVVIDGIKMKETYRKSGDKYNLAMFYNNRFALDIDTKEVNHEELVQMIKELHISGLKKL
jgi:hypothetical protein